MIPSVACVVWRTHPWIWSICATRMPGISSKGSPKSRFEQKQNVITKLRVTNVVNLILYTVCIHSPFLFLIQLFISRFLFTTHSRKKSARTAIESWNCATPSSPKPRTRIKYSEKKYLFVNPLLTKWRRVLGSFFT